MGQLLKYVQSFNANQKFDSVYNMISFFNYDTANPVYIGTNFVLQPAQVIGGVAYPTFLEISLNQGDTSAEGDYWNLDFKGSTTANLVIIYFQYKK
jgi:hypothetical protein